MDGSDADRLVDCVRRQGHHGAQRLGIGGGVVERDGAAVAVADQDAVVDFECGEKLGQHDIGLDFHIGEARIGRPRARLAVGGAVVDHAGALQDVAKLLREVAPHLDAAQPLVQEDERRARQPVGTLRREAADPQRAVAEIDELVVGARVHTSDVAGTRRREKKPIASRQHGQEHAPAACL